MEIWHILIVLGILAFIAEIFTPGFILGSVGQYVYRHITSYGFR